MQKDNQVADSSSFNIKRPKAEMDPILPSVHQDSPQIKISERSPPEGEMGATPDQNSSHHQWTNGESGHLIEKKEVQVKYSYSNLEKSTAKNHGGSKDKTFNGNQVARPTTLSEIVAQLGTELPKIVKIGEQKRNDQRKSYGTTEQSLIAADLSQMSIDDLLAKVMPSDKELKARECTADYAKLLVEISEDAFIRRYSTAAYRELAKRIPPGELASLIFERQTTREVRKAMIDQITAEEIARRMAIPHIRHKAVAWVPNLPDSSREAKSYVILDYGETKWQRLFNLAMQNVQPLVKERLNQGNLELGGMNIDIGDSPQSEEFINSIRKMPETTLQKLQLDCLSASDCSFFYLGMPEQQFYKVLTAIQYNQLREMGFAELPLKEIKEERIKSFKKIMGDFGGSQNLGGLIKTQTSVMEKAPTSLAYLEKSDIDGAPDRIDQSVLDDEDEYQQEHGHKPDKIVEPDPFLLEDYWHLGDPWFDCARIFNNSYVVGNNSTLSTFEGLAYCAVISVSSDNKYPSHASILDVKSLQPLTEIAGAYLAFSDQEFIYVLQIVDDQSNRGEEAFTLQRRILIYRAYSLPSIDLVEKYSVGTIEQSVLEELQFAASYTSACQAKEGKVKLLYCNDAGYCRAVLKIDSSVADRIADLQLPKDLDRGAKRHLYFFDWCSQLAMIDLDSKMMTLMQTTIVFGQSQVSINTTKTSTLDLSAISPDTPLPSMNLHWTTRDPSFTAHANWPLPLFNESKVLEIERSKPTKESAGVDQTLTLIEIDFQIQDEIIWVCKSGIYYTIMTRVADGTFRLIISRKSPEPAMITRLEASKYSQMSYNGKVLLLQNKLYQFAHAVSLPLDYSQVAETSKHFSSVKTMAIGTSKYGYLENNKICVRRIMDNSLLHEFEIRNITGNCGVDVLIESLGFNMDCTFALLIVRMPNKEKFLDGSNFWLFRIDLAVGSFSKLDVIAKALDLDRDYLRIEHEGIVSVYYFDHEGRLIKMAIPPYDIDMRSYMTQQHNGVWLYKHGYTRFAGYKGMALDWGFHLDHAFICRQPPESSIVALHTYSEIMVFDLEENMQRIARKQMSLTSAFKFRFKKYQFPEIALACIDATGVLCFVVDLVGHLHRLILHENEKTVGSKRLLDLKMKVSSPPVGSIRFNHDFSCVLVQYPDRGRSILKVVSVQHGDLLYTIDNCPGFPHEAKNFSGYFDFNSFKLVGMIEKGLPEPSICRTEFFKKQPGFNEDRTVEFRLVMTNYMNIGTGYVEAKRLALRNLENILRAQEPIDLIKDKALFILLAKMKDTEVFSIYVDHCSLRKMLVYGNLIEWLFSNKTNGKRLRKLMVEKLDEVAYFNDGEIDAFDFNILDKLVMFRYTPRLLIEPEARQIFIRLLRMPVTRTHKGEREQLTLELDDTELDQDHDTGHFLELGDQVLQHSELLPDQMRAVKRRLSQLKGNNLVEYTVWMSSIPIDLSVGSQVCTELFKLFDTCPSVEINESLRPLIYLQWQNIYWIAFIYMLIYWTYASMCYAFFGFQFKSTGLGVAIIALSGLYLVFEMMSWRSHGMKYLTIPWNVVDILIYIGCIVLVPLLWQLKVEHLGWAVGRAVIIAVVWLRALTWLRVFRPVRYLITMVLRVFYDMIAWLVILTGSIIGMALVWRLSYYFGPQNDKFIEDLETAGLLPTFFASLQTVTMMVLGNMPATEDDASQFSVVRFIVAVAFGIVFPLALANLLIAVINKTYAEIEDTKKVHDLIEVIGFIVDFSGSLSALKGCRCLQKRKYVLYIAKKPEEEPLVA